MDEREHGSLAERVERLEARVEEQGRELQRAVRRLERPLAGKEPTPLEQRSRAEDRVLEPPVEAPDPAR